VCQGLRVPIALASEAAVQSPLRVLRSTEMSVSGIRSHLRSPSCARIATLWLACFWRCGNRAIALLRVWRLTQMSVSGFRSSRAVHASSLASLTLPQPCLCHWVPMIGELCTHRIESLVVLGVVATEPEPLRV
jgi:hypothetical protein